LLLLLLAVDGAQEFEGSCFEGTHGAQCDVCMNELFYAYGEKQKGKTVAQIRKGIIEGEWKNVTPEQAQALN